MSERNNKNVHFYNMGSYTGCHDITWHVSYMTKLMKLGIPQASRP